MSVSLNNVNSLLNTVNSENDTHRAATNNPHGVNAAQIGVYTKSEVDGIINTSNEGIPFANNSHAMPTDSQLVNSSIDQVYRFKEVYVGNSGAVRNHNNAYGHNNGVGGDWSALDGNYTGGNYIWAIYKTYYDANSNSWKDLTGHRFFTDSNLSLENRLSDGRALTVQDSGYINLSVGNSYIVGKAWFHAHYCISKLVFGSDGIPRAYLMMGNATYWSNTIIALFRLS